MLGKPAQMIADAETALKKAAQAHQAAEKAIAAKATEQVQKQLKATAKAAARKAAEQLQAAA